MKLDWNAIHTVPLARRKHLVTLEMLGEPVRIPGIEAFLDGLPDQLAGRDLRRLVKAMRRARELKKPIVWGVGGHVVKTGVTPHVHALMQAGYVTAVAMNGAAAIHDFELAYAGATSEDVQGALEDGRFGVATETGEMMNHAANEAYGSDMGLGEIWGRLVEENAFPHREHSLLATCQRHGVQATCHLALGTDVTHFHPSCDWTSLGKAAQIDFRRFAETIAEIEGGGVYLNVGSAVVMPEVFLKAVAAVGNLGTPLGNFVTASLDMLRPYRPTRNVVQRAGGQGLAITGHHEILVPLLATILLS